MRQRSCNVSSANTADVIESGIVDGLAQCKPIGQIADEIASALQHKGLSDLSAGDVVGCPTENCVRPVGL